MKNSWNHLHSLSKCRFLISSDHVLQLLGKQLSEENSRNQLNNWKKIFPDQVQAQGHKFSTKICSVLYRYVSADLILWLLVMLLCYKNGYNVPNLIQ